MPPLSQGAAQPRAPLSRGRRSAEGAGLVCLLHLPPLVQLAPHGGVLGVGLGHKLQGSVGVGVQMGAAAGLGGQLARHGRLSWAHGLLP